MSDLARYLDAENIKTGDFAIRCKTSAATISRIAGGTLRPGLDLAHRIERETGGAVPTEVWERVEDPGANGSSSQQAAA